MKLPVATDPEDNTWQDYANCLGVDPDLFFPSVVRPRARPRRCAGAASCAQCLEYALVHSEKFGIWGGMSERERRRIRRQRLARRPAPPRPDRVTTGSRAAGMPRRRDQDNRRGATRSSCPPPGPAPPSAGSIRSRTDRGTRPTSSAPATAPARPPGPTPPLAELIGLDEVHRNLHPPADRQPQRSQPRAPDLPGDPLRPRQVGICEPHVPGHQHRIAPRGGAGGGVGRAVPGRAAAPEGQAAHLGQSSFRSVSEPGTPGHWPSSPETGRGPPRRPPASTRPTARTARRRRRRTGVHALVAPQVERGDGRPRHGSSASSPTSVSTERL